MLNWWLTRREREYCLTTISRMSETLWPSLSEADSRNFHRPTSSSFAGLYLYKRTKQPLLDNIFSWSSHKIKYTSILITTNNCILTMHKWLVFWHQTAATYFESHFHSPFLNRVLDYEYCHLPCHKMYLRAQEFYNK